MWMWRSRRPPYAGITRSGSDGRWRRPTASHPLSPVGPSSRVVVCDVTSQPQSGDRAVSPGEQRAARLADWGAGSGARPWCRAPPPGRDRADGHGRGPGGAMPGKGARGGADMRRAAAVLLLVAVAAVGLRAGGAFSATGDQEILGMSGWAVYWLIAGAEVILGLAGIALLIARLIWARKSGVPLRRQRRSLWWLLLLPLVVFGLAKLLRMRQRLAPARRTAGQTATTAGPSGHHLPGTPWPLLVLFAVAAFAAAALITYRRRQTIPRPASEDASDPAAATLAAALAAGARALHEDP